MNLRATVQDVRGLELRRAVRARVESGQLNPTTGRLATASVVRRLPTIELIAASNVRKVTSMTSRR